MSYCVNLVVITAYDDHILGTLYNTINTSAGYEIATCFRLCPKVPAMLGAYIASLQITCPKPTKQEKLASVEDAQSFVASFLSSHRLLRVLAAKAVQEQPYYTS